jgi:hypothetical protein
LFQKSRDSVPLSFTFVSGINDLLARGGGKKILPVLPQLIIPIKCEKILKIFCLKIHSKNKKSAVDNKLSAYLSTSL